MSARSTKDSGSKGVGKAVLGGAVFFALYFLITGRSGSRNTHAPQDVARLSFLMTGPRAPGHPASFQLRTEGKLDPKLYTVEELIARVKEGGRSDVELQPSGAVIQGPWNAAREAVKHAGLTVWEAATLSTRSPPNVAGNIRGTYRGYW